MLPEDRLYGVFVHPHISASSLKCSSTEFSVQLHSIPYTVCVRRLSAPLLYYGVATYSSWHWSSTLPTTMTLCVPPVQRRNTIAYARPALPPHLITISGSKACFLGYATTLRDDHVLHNDKRLRDSCTSALRGNSGSLCLTVATAARRLPVKRAGGRQSNCENEGITTHKQPGKRWSNTGCPVYAA